MRLEPIVCLCEPTLANLANLATAIATPPAALHFPSHSIHSSSTTSP